MYQKLIVEMKKRNITMEDIAAVLDERVEQAAEKAEGNASFSFDESVQIQKRLFPDCDIMVLFKKI